MNILLQILLSGHKIAFTMIAQTRSPRKGRNRKEKLARNGAAIRLKMTAIHKEEKVTKTPRKRAIIEVVEVRAARVRQNHDHQVGLCHQN